MGPNRKTEGPPITLGNQVKKKKTNLTVNLKGHCLQAARNTPYAQQIASGILAPWWKSNRLLVQASLIVFENQPQKSLEARRAILKEEWSTSSLAPKFEHLLFHPLHLLDNKNFHCGF